MIGKYGAFYIIWADTIEKTLASIRSPMATAPTSGTEKVSLALLGKDPPLEPSVAALVKGNLALIASNLSHGVLLPSVNAQHRRIEGLLNQKAGAKEIEQAVLELKNRLFDELCERQFLYVSPAKTKFYTEPMLFGRIVNDRFPTAIDDIEEAGKCLALGQATACVLHVIRVLEVGLKALAAALKIPYAPSWESYLRQIAAKIDEKHKNKTAKWKKDEKFYRDLSGDLIVIKQAFRNPTMHVGRKYGDEEAEQIFNSAKTFMSRLASHFNEKAMEALLK